MGNKNKRNKETSVSDVEQKEDLQNSEEVIEETGAGDEGHRDESGPEGEAGEAGDAGSDEGGEEPPASGSEDQGGVDAAEVNEPTQEAPVVAEEPAIEQPEAEPASSLGESLEAAAQITTLTQLAEAAPAPQAKLPAAPTSDKADALIAYIREYVEKMDPSKYQDAKSGVPHQTRLYKMLVELSKLEFLDFKVGMDKLLKLIFEYRHAAFSELYSRRFFENLYPKLTHDQVREFDDLLSILVTVGSSTNRSRAMTQVDLGAALKSIKNAKAQQNMSAYFSALR